MSNLDAYTKCVNLKKILQTQLTYERIQRIFEDCCSFMDFYATMKDFGIDRKTAKYFACQFGGLGLKNQGTVAYCGFAKLPDFELEDGKADPSNKEVDIKIDPAEFLREKNNYQRPVNVPEVPPDEFTITETSECWDNETDANRSFVIKLMKPAVALSVTIDEFVSPSKKTTPNGCKQKLANNHGNSINKTEFRKKKKRRNKRNQFTEQNCENNQVITDGTADGPKNLHVQSSASDDVLPERNGEEPETCTQEVLMSENCSSHSVVTSSKNNPPLEHHQKACTKDEHNDLVPRGNTLQDIPTTSKEKGTAKTDQLGTHCVVFADDELDERQKNWPRVRILIGDINIYVPVETSTPEEVKNI